MMLPPGVYQSRWTPAQAQERDRRRDKVIAQMRAFLDKLQQKDEEERRIMAAAVQELRDKGY